MLFKENALQMQPAKFLSDAIQGTSCQMMALVAILRQVLLSKSKTCANFKYKTSSYNTAKEIAG